MRKKRVPQKRRDSGPKVVSSNLPPATKKPFQRLLKALQPSEFVVATVGMRKSRGQRFCVQHHLASGERLIPSGLPVTRERLGLISWHELPDGKLLRSNPNEKQIANWLQMWTANIDRAFGWERGRSSAQITSYNSHSVYRKRNSGLPCLVKAPSRCLAPLEYSRGIIPT